VYTNLLRPLAILLYDVKEVTDFTNVKGIPDFTVWNSPYPNLYDITDITDVTDFKDITDFKDVTDLEAPSQLITHSPHLLI
jgi:hypothetical protein